MATPTAVEGIADGAAIGIGASHSCALNRAGAVYCWGWNEGSALGVRDVEASGTPVKTLAAGARALAVAYFQTCAIVDEGAVMCWGAALPDGTALPVPTKIEGVEDAVSLSVNRDEMCIERRDHEPKCWHSTVPSQPAP